VKAARQFGITVLFLLPLTACATSTTVAVDKLSPAQRATALLGPADPARANCTIRVTPLPAPEKLVDVEAVRKALPAVVPPLPDTGSVLLSVLVDSTGHLTEDRILYTTLSDSAAERVAGTLKGHVRLLRDEKGRPTLWRYRMRIDPASPGLIAIGSPIMCRPELLNRSIVRGRLDRKMAAYMAARGGRGPAGDTSYVTIWMFIDTTGKVLRTRFPRSSGYAVVDGIAREAAMAARFAPAILDGQPRPVWVELPFVLRWTTPVKKQDDEFALPPPP
jgi:hypothetical protein